MFILWPAITNECMGNPDDDSIVCVKFHSLLIVLGGQNIQGN